MKPQLARLSPQHIWRCACALVATTPPVMGRLRDWAKKQVRAPELDLHGASSSAAGGWGKITTLWSVRSEANNHHIALSRLFGRKNQSGIRACANYFIKNIFSAGNVFGETFFCSVFASLRSRSLRSHLYLRPQQKISQKE